MKDSLIDLVYKEIESDLAIHIWITVKKEKIPVREMSTEHIKNCISCLEGKGNMKLFEKSPGARKKWFKIFKDELISRN